MSLTVGEEVVRVTPPATPLSWQRSLAAMI